MIDNDSDPADVGRETAANAVTLIQAIQNGDGPAAVELLNTLQPFELRALGYAVAYQYVQQQQASSEAASEDGSAEHYAVSALGDCRALVNAVSSDPIAAAEVVAAMDPLELASVALAAATRLASMIRALEQLGIDPATVWATPTEGHE